MKLIEKKHTRAIALLLTASALLGLLCGCGATEETIDFSANGAEAVVYAPENYVEPVTLEGIDLTVEAESLSLGPVSLASGITPTASGTKTKSDNDAVIDYSNTADGYVMVQYKKSITNKLKVQVVGPTTTYSYNIDPQTWVSLPLSDGNGSYQIAVYKNVQDSKYALLVSVTVSVTLKDEFAPFLTSNQYVNYAAAPNTVARAAELTKNCKTTMEKIKAVYEEVVAMTYDKTKATTVTSGYLPNLDAVLAAKTGICFDFASLMTGMLRSQGIPCKLVVGYAGTTYHAWINVYTEENGWVNSAIYFDGTTWQRMDPTFASSGKQSTAVMTYIGTGSNYTAKYYY